MKKSFVLDTNVLLHNSEAIYVFADNEVVIPLDVLEELDEFKKDTGDIGRNARQVSRSLDKLRAGGNLLEGAPVGESGGSVRVLMSGPEDLEGTPLRKDIPDNRIIAVALRLQKEGRKVVFVSKDINARIKADALGVKAMDFEKQKVNFDELFEGWKEVEAEASLIDEFYRKKTLSLSGQDCYPNEFVLLRDKTNPKKTALGRYDCGSKALKTLENNKPEAYGIRPRNLQQTMAFDLLLDEKVELVTLVGQAGTGKTLVALACGLAMAFQQRKYDRLLITRPIMPLGRDIGFLPGSKEEKLLSWMQPIFDNLKFIFQLRSGKESEESADKRIDGLIDSNKLEIEALTYIRGRSIPRQYFIVDEAQNLTPHEVKTIISRAGEGTKVVLTGDATQIDNPYLDANSNGLTYTVERMKEQEVFGHITLTKSERSRLASLAAELL